MVSLVGLVAFIIGTVIFGLRAFGGGDADADWGLFFWGIGFCCMVLGAAVGWARDRA